METFVFISDTLTKPGAAAAVSCIQSRRGTAGVSLCKYRACEVYSLLASRTVMWPETEGQIRIEYTDCKYASVISLEIKLHRC